VDECQGSSDVAMWLRSATGNMLCVVVMALLLEYCLPICFYVVSQVCGVICSMLSSTKSFLLIRIVSLQ